MSIYQILTESGLSLLSSESYNDYVDMYEKARKEIVGNKMKKLVSLRYELETLGKVETTLKHTIEGYEEKLKQKMAEEHNNKYMFFTINPKPSVKLEDFLKVVAKSVTKTCFTDYLYVVEQRGTNSATAGKGFHAHILVKRNLQYKPFKCKKNMQNTYLKMCDVKKEALFNVKYLNTEWALDKVSYISSGGKTGEGKDVKQDIDVWWRKQNNIQPYYGSMELTLH